MDLLIILYFCVIGATISSFLGVIIDRLPKKESFIKGRSHCDTCQRQLSPLELIPIVSYLIQGGKCKVCKSPLSIRYIVIEILGALAFLCSFFAFGFTHQLWISWILACLLLVISYIDIDHLIIYDRFHVLLLILGAINLAFGYHDIWSALIGALIVSIPLAILSITTGAMGFGDVKLMAAAGFLLGYKAVLVAFIIGVVLGGVYSLVLILRKKASGKTAIPFGPFLCFGIFIAYLVGQPLFNWYIHLII